jgi:aspartate aminotransferase-like enzyme
VLVGVAGVFGERMCELARRLGARLHRVDAEPGTPLDPSAMAEAIGRVRPKLVAFVHGETSTGVLQPLDELARLAHEHDALFMADAVVTLGGCDVAVDRWDVDVAVGGTQKCLSCPSGLAPITYGARAHAALAARRQKIRTNYLDLTQLARYWSASRFNHHTAPTAMVYGLREALRAFYEEGRVPRFARHRLHGDAMRCGVEALGLIVFGKEAPPRRLPFLVPVTVPDGVDDVRVRRRLVEEFGVEIGGAFGPLQNRIWRIGLMGHSASRQNVLIGLAALEHVLRAEGWRCAPGAGVDAARACYRAAGITEIDTADSLDAPGTGRV